MSTNRVSRNEAWIASVAVHAALLAGAVVFLGRPRETVVAVMRADGGPEIGVITLAEPAVAVAKAAAMGPLLTGPVAVTPPVQPPPPPTAPVRTVDHRETVTVPSWMPAAPTIHSADGPGSASQTVSGPVAQAAGSDGQRGSGREAHVSGAPLPAGAVTAFFGLPAVGKSVVFVLDRSASMGLSGRLEGARRELAGSLRRLPATARFQVIAYNRSLEPVRMSGITGLLPATPDAVEAVIAAVQRMPAEGSTDHAAALTAALALGPDVIYFLTDEDDLELRDVQVVTRRNHGRASIHAICLTETIGETPMRVLARENRGQFAIVTSCQITTCPTIPQ